MISVYKVGITWFFQTIAENKGSVWPRERRTHVLRNVFGSSLQFRTKQDFIHTWLVNFQTIVVNEGRGLAKRTSKPCPVQSF